jgi:hypothetical protein
VASIWRQNYWLFLLYGILCVAVYIHLQVYPSLADAKNYVSLALQFRNNGFLSNFGSLWTYFYPAVLHFLSFVSGPQHIAEAATILQCILYALLAAGISSEVSRYSKSLGMAVLTGLLLNALAVILLVDTLTEGLTIVLALGLTWTILRSCRSQSYRMVFWLTLGAAFAGAALMVRPANITLLLAWHCAALYQCFKDHHQLRSTASYVLAALLVSIAITAPQLVYNLREFGKATILPAADLGSNQMTWGIMMMKYATMVVNHGAAPVIYNNPFFNSEDLSKGALDWYINNPAAGIKTVLIHLFNAFSWDYPFVYVYDLTPWYRVVFTFSVWLLMFLGLYEVFRSSATFFQSKELRNKASGAIIFIVLVAGSIISLNSITAVENRFNILPTMLLFVFAAKFAWDSRARVHRKTITLLSCLALLSGGATYGTFRVQEFAAPIVEAKRAASQP